MTGPGTPRWRTARPNMPVVVPAPGEEGLDGEPVAACSGGLEVAGGAAETAVAERTSLLSHLFFRLQPPHHWSLSSLKRARQAVPPGLLSPPSLSVAGTGSPGGRDSSARLVGGVPGSPPSPSRLGSRSPSLQMVGGGHVPGGSCTLCTTWCGQAAPTGRLAGDLFLLAGSAVPRGRFLLDEASRSSRTPSSPGSSPRAGATALEPVVPPAAVAASALASVSARACGGGGVGGGAGAEGSEWSAAGPGSGGGVQS